jgi:Zn-dependent protease with chaperone function
MQNNALKVSQNFKKMAIRAVLSIVLFLSTYLVLVILGIGLIFLCGLAAYALVALYFSVVTLMLGIGFVGMGLMIFYFLIKFIFSAGKKIDRSHLVEINEVEQPELFKLIREIVEEVQTKFPKQVYLSSDVNAAVFYDSNFWSMFFPVRKNLQIGVGLMNAVSALELKAILAHEFGHFSQRSMKVGSYVYNMNKIIYNILYDNEDYNTMLEKWANVSSYFVLFSRGAILVIRGIQYVLVKVYRVLNLNYMALSREMEFHADAVAASVTGSVPLVTSLLRLELADQSLSAVFEYYNTKIADATKTADFYPQHYFVMNHRAQMENLPVEGGLPNVSVDIFNKLSKSKLVLHDQWSSHPGTEERVSRLLALNQPVKGINEGIAIDILRNKQAIQELMTARLFENVTYETNPAILEAKDFIHDYLTLEEKNSYPSAYRGYFDSRSPYTGFTASTFDSAVITGEEMSVQMIFDDEILEVLSSLNSALADKQALQNIADGHLEINTFDYDGQRYSAPDTYSLIRYLDEEIKSKEELLNAKDISIFNDFLNNAIHRGCASRFKDKSIAYQSVAAPYQKQVEVYLEMMSSTYFMTTTTSFEQIKSNLFLVKKNEIPFREQVKVLLESEPYQEFIDAEMRLYFEEYVTSDWPYFADTYYFDKQVDVLFAVMSGYLMVLNKVNFTVQKDLLEFCLTLVDPVQSKITTVETNITSMETEIRAAGTNPNMTLING